MAISLSSNQARSITARSALLPGEMRRPIQTNEIESGRNAARLPPFTEEALRARGAVGANACSQALGEKALAWMME
jgi:hypothetical protein